MSQQPNCFVRLWQDRYGKNVQEDVRLFLDNMLACSLVAGLLILFHQYEIWFYYRRFMRKPLTEIQLYKLNIEAAGVKNWNHAFKLDPFAANTPINSMAASHSRLAIIQSMIWMLRILYYLSFVYIAWFLYKFIGPLAWLAMQFVWICIFQYSIKYLLWEIQQLIKKALDKLNPAKWFKKKKKVQDDDYTKYDPDAKSDGPNWSRDFYSKWWNNFVMKWWRQEIESYRRKTVGSPLFKLIKTIVYYIVLPFNLAGKTLLTAKTVGVDAPYKEFKTSLGQIYPTMIEKPGRAWFDDARNYKSTIYQKLQQQKTAPMLSSSSFARAKWARLKSAGFYILIAMIFAAAFALVVAFQRSARTSVDVPSFLKHMKAMFSGIKA